MINLSNSIKIRSDFKEVFSFLSHLENFSLWNYAIKSVVREENPTQIELPRYRLCRQAFGREMFEDVEVVDYIQDRSFKANISGGWFRYTMSYKVVPLKENEETLLVNNATIDSSGFIRVILKSKGIQYNLKNAVFNNLLVLKNTLESSETF